jgi:hypothetical protein
MTLEYREDAAGGVTAHLVECPFCEAWIGADGRPADHLIKCDAFYRAFDKEPPASPPEICGGFGGWPRRGGDNE